MRCTLAPSDRPGRARRRVGSSSFGCCSVFVTGADDGPAEVEAAAAAVEEEDEDFLDWRAEVKIPSGTTRSRNHGIVSIVFRFPSVLFVKYASVAQKSSACSMDPWRATH